MRVWEPPQRTGLKDLETHLMWGKSSGKLWGTDLELGRVLGP